MTDHGKDDPDVPLGLDALRTLETERKPLALVIDDSPFALRAATRALTAQGWEVHAVDSAEGALCALTHIAPDVVVCDVHLPDVDGLALVRRVAALPDGPPVIALSGDRALDIVLEAIRTGAFDYVVKSTDLATALPAAVDRAWRHGRVLRENRRLAQLLDARCAELEREVDVRARAEAALRDARDAALAGSRAKSAFLANMSHELRTPLNAILGYADLLAEDLEADADPRVDDVRRIRAAGSHLLSLIKDVLDLAKIEAGRQTVDVGDVDLTELVAQARTATQPLFDARGNVANYVLNATPTLWTDEVKLRQCLINLLGNAAKFTDRGVVTLTVSEEPTAGGAPGVRFDVTDTGIGMTAEQLGRVFDAFEQADTSSTRRYDGTGLGLTITRRLVDLLGGHITVCSEPGRGSTFSIHLPVRRPA